MDASVSAPDYDDTAVRRRIGPWTEDGVPDLSAFEPDTNFFVRAAAGSGKTTALVARMVALVRKGGVPAEDLTAITFTRKAAGEMNARFFRELRRARRAAEPGTPEAERLEQALANAQRTFIGTIHAFCARLLRERPLAAGLPPDFAAGLEDRERRELRERAWQRYLQSVREEHPERIERMIALGLEPGDLEAYFETLCRYPELTPYTQAPDRVPDLDAVVAAARERLDQWRALQPASLPKGRDPVMRAFEQAANMLQYQDLDTPAQQAAFLELFDDLVRDGQAKCKVTYWGDARAEATTLRDEALPSFVEETIRPVLRPWRAHVHAQVVDFVRPAVGTFRRLRRDEGQLTFHDLLLRTRDLLRDHPDFRRHFAEQYPRLLVDEFQDTDPLQAEILFYLTSRSPTTTDWRDCRPRPGSLFIVGDDKQSIYRFRRADKEVFDEVGALIEKSGGEAVDLTKNFRSVARICDWCDRAFSDVFDEPETRDLQANYVPFDPQRPEGPAGTALRRIDIDKVHRNRGADIAAANAEQIARFVRAAVDDRLNDRYYGGEASVFGAEADYSDFLVLTRTKSRLSVFAETLAAYDIPYTVTGSEDLGDTEELKAVVDLMTCALRPDDPVACVAYLKGPLVGCSDDDLYRYRRAGGRFDRMHEPVPAPVRDDLDAPLCDRITGAFERLRRARTLLREARPAAALEQIADECGLLAGAAHPPDAAEGSLRAGAVLRILTEAQNLAAQGRDWAEVRDELQRVLDGEATVDGMTLETGQGTAVRLMNVHQAKGLEAPVVFLADPYSSGSGPSTTRHVRRDTSELVAPVVQGTGHYQTITHAPLGWHDDSEAAFRVREERHEQAEEHRLLYVAATRARNLLVVSTYPEKPESGPWAPLYPHLDAADVPPLDPPATDPARSRAAPAPDLEETRTARTDRIETRTRPSYVERSVTDAEGEAPIPGAEDADGYGAAFGRALHLVVEGCVRERQAIGEVEASRARQALRDADADVSSSSVDRVRAMGNALLGSALWDEVRRAPTAYAEYPVAHRTDGAPPTLVRGTIDLLYRRDDGWGIVDIKSDRLGGYTAPALPDDHPYRRQVRQYAALWERMADESVTRAGIWWADAAQFVDVGEAAG